MGRRLIDLTDSIVGNWHILRRGPTSETGQTRWWCQCASCGAETLVFGANILRAQRGFRGGSAGCSGCRTPTRQAIEAGARARAAKAETERSAFLGLTPQRQYHLWAIYRLRPADCQAMFDGQGGRCALTHCRADLESPWSDKVEVDHDHATGAVCALLCARCNTTLGRLKESVSVAQSFADYLTRTKKTSKFNPSALVGVA
jgi:hypothetical protein